MFSGMALPYLMVIFVGAAIVVWRAGTSLSNQTDLLSDRSGLGQALGGVILLAIATNLPETAIMVSAVAGNDVGVAIGNILGGIAIQTVVLVILDICTPDHRTSLTNEGASLMLAVEGMLVIMILALVVMATQLPDSAIFARIAPGTLGIAMTWVAGVWLIGKARKDLPWQLKNASSHHDSRSDANGKSGAGTAGSDDTSQKASISTMRSALIFVVAAIATLIGGVLLERTGNAIAPHIGMSGVIFGATVLAAATSLPELSTGLASVKMKDYELAVSDILGGNAFLPVLLLFATLLSGKAVLAQAQRSDIYLTALGAVLTSIYILGVIIRPKRVIGRMGLDSLLVLIVYLAGLAGLFLIPQ